MKEAPKASGSEIALRGLLLLALLLIVAIGSYAIFFRRATPATPPPAPVPQVLAPMIALPLADFPGTVSWAALYAFADENPSPPGWQIRFQAARSLAQRGSNDVPWDEYRELLSERRMLGNFRTKLEDGRVVIEEAAARQIIMGALRDLAAWHAKHPKIAPSQQLLFVYDAVDELAKSPIPELKAQAEKTRATFFPRPKGHGTSR